MRRSEGDLQCRPRSSSPSRARARDRRDDRDRSRSDGPRRADNPPGTKLSPLRHTGTSPLSPGPLVPWAMTQTNPNRTCLSPIGGLGGNLVSSGPNRTRPSHIGGLGGNLVWSGLVSSRLVSSTCQALSSRQHECGPSSSPFAGPRVMTPDGHQGSKWNPTNQGEVRGDVPLLSDRGPQYPKWGLPGAHTGPGEDSLPVRGHQKCVPHLKWSTSPTGDPCFQWVHASKTHWPPAE